MPAAHRPASLSELNTEQLHAADAWPSSILDATPVEHGRQKICTFRKTQKNECNFQVDRFRDHCSLRSSVDVQIRFLMLNRIFPDKRNAFRRIRVCA
jgi:hypothetical protein